MGGLGSGRHGLRPAKDTTEGALTLDIRRLKREGLLVPHITYNWNWRQEQRIIASIEIDTGPSQINLSYRPKQNGHERKHRISSVSIDWTSCHFGGKRPWFICPVEGCGRRVAIIYFNQGFACRHCLNLAYQTQHETSEMRAGRRADKIRHRLGWELGILNGIGDRPKGMHRSTFRRLTEQHHKLAGMALSSMPSRDELFGHNEK